MGLPLFISPPSPTSKNATTNTEKAVAQHRSAIRRQRTVRGTPNWALSEIRVATVPIRHSTLSTDSDHEADLEAMRAEANAIRSENVARRRINQNRHTLRDSLSYERRNEANQLRAHLRGERLFPHAPAAPPTIPDTVTHDEPARDNTRARQSYMDHYTRIQSELTRVRGSSSRSTSPPLPSYTPGFSPAHVIESDIRSSSLRRQSPERSSSSQREFTRLRNDRLGARLRRPPGYLTPPRASHGTPFTDMIAQRGHRIRARDLPDGLGDRDRSISPDAPVNWDTLSVTLAPDPQAPSTRNSSFASANASTNPSTAIASVASSASDSHSSATSASETSHRDGTYDPGRFFYRPPMSPPVGTRSIPDFSIPSNSTENSSASQSRSPNPGLAVDGNCDSADELDIHEPNENVSFTNERNLTNNEIRNISEHNEPPNLAEDNAEEDDLYELAELEARVARAYYPGSNEDIHAASEPRSRLPNLSMISMHAPHHHSLSEPQTEPPTNLRARTVRMGLEEMRRSFISGNSPEREAAADTDLDSETNTLGGMQRIVRMLAERRDIPDTWWAGAGLSRTAGRSVVRDREGDDDMRLEG